jgi:hypothetical protein
MIFPSVERRNPTILRNRTDLPVPEPPTTKNFAALNIKIQPLMHALYAKAVNQIANLNDCILRHLAHHPISMKNSAATASSKITTKIECTTLVVV